MKKQLLVFGALLALGAFDEARAAAGDSVFSGLKIHTVNFIFPKDWNGQPNDTVAWSTIHQQLINNKEAEIYIPAKLEINCDVQQAPTSCIRMDSVGVRYKGNSTFSSGGQKRPFRISFDEYGIDQRWDGVKGFTLNNGWSDPSLMAEKIHMDFAVERAGMAGPRMAYAVVKTNGKPHSFYMMGELADGRLLDRFFGEKDGDLFKAIDGLSNNSDFTTASIQNNNRNRYEYKGDSATRGWTRLTNVITAVNGNNVAQEMPALINMNSVYRGLGTDILFGSTDSYLGAGQNYLVYFPEANGSKMEWIVWDASLSFGLINLGPGGIGGFPGGGGGGGGGTNCSNSATSSIVCSPSARPLGYKIMNTDALKQDYLRALWFLYKAYYEGDWLTKRIDTVASVIRPYLQADTKKLSASYENGFTTLKNFVTNRQASVASQFTTQGISADNAIRNGDVVINEIAPSQNWVEIYNARDYAIDLSGHSLTDDPAQAGKWTFPLGSFVQPRGHRIVNLQGGTLGTSGPTNFALLATGGHLRLNRANGTVVDSVTFGAQAEGKTIGRATDGAATFASADPTPGKANGVSASGLPLKSVVINEFMADNDTIASPAGFKADWVELYNTTASPVDLAGMHLSDNPNNPSKWTFPPGASLAANGYLVVWAYDTTVAGNALFARWALSKDGEHIRLSNADLSVVDTVTFGPQTKNRVMARVPNGTGAFQGACLPTPGANNGNCVTGLASGRGILAADAFNVGFARGRFAARFTLENAATVRLSVLDARGREVALLWNGRLEAGRHERVLDAGALPAGTYVFRLRADGVERTRAGVLMK